MHKQTIHTPAFLFTNLPGRGLCIAAGVCAPTLLIIHLFPHTGLLLHICSRPCAKCGDHHAYLMCFSVIMGGFCLESGSCVVAAKVSLIFPIIQLKLWAFCVSYFFPCCHTIHCTSLLVNNLLYFA